MKRLLTLLVVLILVAPAFAGDMQLKLAINGGYTMISNDDFNEMVVDMVDLYGALLALGGFEGEITSEEIKGFIAPNVELGLKVSSFMAGLKIGIPGSVTSTLIVDAEHTVSGTTMDEEMEMRNWAFPFGLNLYYVLDLGEKMDLYMGAGFEYYMSTITNEQTVSKIDDVDQTLEPAAEFKGSGIAGIINVKGEYTINDMFSLFLGVTGRMGEISGYEGQGDESGTTLYSFDSGELHIWENLTPAEFDAYESNTAITNLKEAAIVMTGFEVYFGLCLNFGL